MISKKLNIDSKIIYERLKRLEVGEMVTYEELSNLIGADVQKKWWLLDKARQYALTQDNLVYKVDANKGLIRMDNAGIVEKTYEYFGKIRRAATRSMKTLVCVNYEKLDNHERIKHNTAASIGGALLLMTKPKKIKAIENKISENLEKLSYRNTLEFLSK